LLHEIHFDLLDRLDDGEEGSVVLVNYKNEELFRRKLESDYKKLLKKLQTNFEKFKRLQQKNPIRTSSSVKYDIPEKKTEKDSIEAQPLLLQEKLSSPLSVDSLIDQEEEEQLKLLEEDVDELVEIFEALSESVDVSKQ
jgi:hypothetical protein